MHFPRGMGIFFPMMHPPSSIAACVLLAPVLAGCLTVESKEYRISVRPDLSGEATITFVNILSESDDTTDISADDFLQLIQFYYEGAQIEEENPGFRNVRKRLFERDGMLWGEVSFSFDSIAAVRLFRYDGSSPFMYFVGSPLSAEQLLETNGTRGPDWMPVVFWQRDTTELYVKTKLVSEVHHQRSLLSHYRKWRAAGGPERQ